MAAVLGLDGTEAETVATKHTFCSLCRRRIFTGDQIRTWEDRLFVTHDNCEAVSDRLHIHSVQPPKRKKRPQRRRR